jgi:membrane carboxypeptidase/penicillin-binding protein
VVHRLYAELLTVVWVGFDNNQPIGLSGSQAALPIWTTFMKRALAGRPSVPFTVPEGIEYAEIDKDTGQLATPMCPKHFQEAFLAGTAPTTFCEAHGANNSVTSLFARSAGSSAASSGRAGSPWSRPDAILP